ncbi:type I secretion system permease/ATPase [Acinetobacter sp. WZC-1]|uniref:type I secretion system permease/ATPase n=1 Tax=Acinetobacter sp. WZC-1 TaxID=3459034 RepID=UPI00403D8906
MTSSHEPQSSELLVALKKYRKSFASIGAFSAVINILMLVPAIYMLQVYDRVLASGNEFTLLMLTLIALGLYTLMGVLEYIRSIVAVNIGLGFNEQARQRVYTAAFEKNLAGLKSNASQSLQDMDNLRQFLTGGAIFALFDAPWFPVYLAVMFLFDFWIGILALGGAVVLVMIAWMNQAWSSRLLKESSQLSVAANLVANNQLQHADAIEAMGMLKNLSRRWQKLHRAYVHKQSIATDRMAVTASLSKSLRIALQSLVLGLGAWLVLEGRMSAGMMIAGSILMGRVLAPVDQIIAAWKQWTSTRLAYERLNTLLTDYPARESTMQLPAPTGQISLEQVSAVPPQGSSPTLVQISCQIAAGTAVGIVGASGSGKSTLARVITGVWKPRIGVVRMDGADIQRWDKDQLGHSIGYLPQDVELFAGTVAENISRFAEPDVEKVIAAARLANVHELILKLPKGYDTALGDSGQGLSGGQRQRIALARALYGSPRIVVLDEPDASLDEVGQKALITAIEQLKKQQITVLLITHRPPILAVTDRLMVLNQGQLKMDDKTQEVLKQLSSATAAKPATPVMAAKQVSSYNMSMQSTASNKSNDKNQGPSNDTAADDKNAVAENNPFDKKASSS